MIARAGKVASKKGKGKTGKYENFWNIRNPETGHIEVHDTEQFEEVALNPEADPEVQAVDEGDEQQDEVFAVNIPRDRHGDRRCREAKEVELARFDEFDAYEEVADDGQKTLPTNWVLTEKVKEGNTIVKARLTVRGDLEMTEDIQTDSPTVRKSNIKLVLTASARQHFDIKSQDVSSAFLQSKPIERDIFVRPPRERRIPGVIWRLKKTVYGLVDASRGFYLNFSQNLMDLGCEKMKMDPAMFIYFDENKNTEEVKEPIGLAVTHVDDMLSAGENKFETDVIDKMKSAFKFGSEEELDFRYVGLNIVQYREGIKVDNNHYVQAMELPNMELVKNINLDTVMNSEGQTEFRSVMGKLTALAHTSRPDICFEVKVLASKFGKANKRDLQTALRRMIKLKSEDTTMCFPDLGLDLDNWVLVGFGDAGVKSMPDKITSVGGHVMALCNKSNNRCCVLSWKSKKIRRKVISSLAGEALAMIGTIGEIVYTRAVLEQLYGKRVNKIPSLVVTDSKNLEEAIQSTSLVEDSWLIPDIAVIKEAIEEKTVTHVRRVKSQEMLANCLTKAGASGAELLNVLRTGEYKLPGGWN